MEGKRTVMFIHAFRKSTASGAQLEAVLPKPREKRTNKEVRWLRYLIDKYRCIEYARRVAQELAGAALHEGSPVSAGLPDSRDKSFLEQMPKWVIERN